MGANKTAGKSKVGSRNARLSATVSALFEDAHQGAAHEINLVEPLISCGLITRTEVKDILATFGVTYHPSLELADDLLKLIMMSAGTSLRQLRLRHVDDMPIVTTKAVEDETGAGGLDPFFGYLEVRLTGEAGGHHFPISRSMHESLAASVFGSRSRRGLSEFYEDFLAFLTLDGRIVFINRSRIAQLRFLLVDASLDVSQPVSEDMVEAAYNYFEVLEMFSGLGIEAAQPVLDRPLIGAIHRATAGNETDLNAILQAFEPVRPSELIELYLDPSTIEAFNVEHLSLAALDQHLTTTGDKFVVEHECGHLSFNRDEVAIVTVPVMRCKNYTDSLQSAHYQSMYAHEVRTQVRDR